ncbi:MAG: O-antigen ligase family protein [Vicingaceae bacterium]
MKVFLFCSIFLLTILLSFFQSLVLSESYYVFSKISVEFTFFLITTFLIIQQKLNINYLLKSIWIFSVITILLSFGQLFKLLLTGSLFSDAIIELNATFGHKNLLASILFLSLPYNLYLFTISKRWQIISITTIILMFVIIWLLQTKAVLIAFFIFFSTLITLTIAKKKAPQQTVKFKILYVSIISFFIVISVISIQYKNYFPRLFDTNSATERFHLWENTSKIIQKNFFTGVGAGNWQVEFPRYGLDKFANPEIQNGLTTFQRPHNDLLWMLSEMGIVGLVSFLLIFISMLFYLFKLKKKEGNISFLYNCFIATVIGYGFISFLDFPLERIEHQVLLLLMFSIITAKYFKQFSALTTTSKNYNNYAVISLAFVLILFSGAVSFNRYIGENHNKKLLKFKQKNNWRKVIEEAKLSTNTFYTIDPMSMPIEWYKGISLFYLSDIENATISFEKANKLHPYNIHIINNLASCYEQKKEHKKAETYYLKALSISSNFEESRLNLSAVYFNQKKYKKAFETIDLCDINSTNEKYHLFLPSILNSFAQELIMKNNNKQDKTLKNIDAIEIYYTAKKKNISFEKLLLQKGY